MCEVYGKNEYDQKATNVQSSVYISVKKCLAAHNGYACDQQVLYNVNHKHTDSESSLVDVAQLLVLGVHQIVDGILVHNTICRDRRRELRKGSLTEQVIVKRLRTVTRGGAPFG